MLKPSASVPSKNAVLKGLHSLNRVPLSLCAELDRCKISIREILDLDEGSLLPLSRATGENINVYVGDVLLGSGEILVIDASLAVRVAELRDKTAITGSEFVDVDNVNAHASS